MHDLSHLFLAFFLQAIDTVEPYLSHLFNASYQTIKLLLSSMPAASGPPQLTPRSGNLGVQCRLSRKRDTKPYHIGTIFSITPCVALIQQIGAEAYMTRD